MPCEIKDSSLPEENGIYGLRIRKENSNRIMENTLMSSLLLTAAGTAAAQNKAENAKQADVQADKPPHRPYRCRPTPGRCHELHGKSCSSYPQHGCTGARWNSLHERLLLHTEQHAGTRRAAHRILALASRYAGLRPVGSCYRYEMPAMLKELGYFTFGIGKMHWFPQKACTVSTARWWTRADVWRVTIS